MSSLIPTLLLATRYLLLATYYLLIITYCFSHLGHALMKRAFEIDWSRCNTERFRHFVGREDDAAGDGELDAELGELKTALKDKCGLAYSTAP